MKIRTNAGEVELTAEMVCRGMVFAPKDPRDYALGEGRVFVVGRRDDANGIWRDARDENLGTNLLGADRLLGCDPVIATRADCERYGVHGDAGGHGFARVRGGGAIDLRRQTLPAGARVQGGGGGYVTVGVDRVDDRPLYAHERFVGLSADHASPEDVRRLCCGAREAETIATLGGFAGISPTGRVCTLAIGEHDTHEDIATGVKWSAGAERYLSDAKNGPCHIGVDPAQPGTEATAFVSAAMRKAGESLAALGEAAKHAAESAMPVPAAVAIKWEMGTASLGQSQAHVMRDGDVCRWQVNHLGLRIREGVEPHASPAMQRAGDLLRDVHAATAGIEWLAGFFGLLFRIHDATPAAKRAKQEAPLVALVAAVPEGLDPIGWRAAVLGTMEQLRQVGDDGAEIRWRLTDERPEKPGSVERLIREEAYSLPLRLYQRAIAPAAKVDRVRATWKTRGPVLPCDNGEDE